MAGGNLSCRHPRQTEHRGIPIHPRMRLGLAAGPILRCRAGRVNSRRPRRARDKDMTSIGKSARLQKPWCRWDGGENCEE